MKKFAALLALIFFSSTLLAQGVVNKDSLLRVYITGAKPTQNHFHSWLNSYYHNQEDVPIQYGKLLYFYGFGNDTLEQDGNIRLGGASPSQAALSFREGGIWSDLLRFPTFGSIPGRWVSMHYDLSSTLGFAIANEDTLGQNALIMALPTVDEDTFSIAQYFDRTEVESNNDLFLIGEEELWIYGDSVKIDIDGDTGGNGDVLTATGGGFAQWRAPSEPASDSTSFSAMLYSNPGGVSERSTGSYHGWSDISPSSGALQATDSSITLTANYVYMVTANISFDVSDYTSCGTIETDFGGITGLDTRITATYNGQYTLAFSGIVEPVSTIEAVLSIATGGCPIADSRIYPSAGSISVVALRQQ